MPRISAAKRPALNGLSRPVEEQRCLYLDGLRGGAAVIVVMCHFVLAFQPAFLSGNAAQGAFAASTGVSRTPLVLLWSPDFAVTTFFVLSGFVLSAASSRPARRNPAIRLSGQMVRRWLRLTGPILASSLLVWAILETGWIYNMQAAALNHSDWIAMHYGWLAWEPNSLPVLIRQSVFGIFVFGTQWWNAALWTMPIEFIGSLGVFVTYAVLRGVRRRIRIVCFACALAALCGTNYSGFAAGGLLWEALGARNTPEPRTRLRWLCGAASFAAAVILGGTPYDVLGTFYWRAFVFASAHLTDPVMAAHRLGAGLMVASALIWSPLQHLLQRRLMLRLGRMSFMVYLCHTVVLCSLTSWIVVRMAPIAGYDLATLLAFVATAAVLPPLALVMSRLFDAPSIALSRRAETRLYDIASTLGRIRTGTHARLVQRRLVGPNPAAVARGEPEPIAAAPELRAATTARRGR